jgi:hypothetical protein
MTEDLLVRLKAIDPAVLTEVVRQDQHDPGLIIQDWTVEPIGHERFLDTTGGLFRFNGKGESTLGIRPWTVALKWIINLKTEGQQPGEWGYWRREIMAYQSSFLEQLPPGIRAPRCYGIKENEDGAWVWMENIKETTGKRWSLETFQLTARQLGRIQGAYLCGSSLPDRPWLLKSWFRNVWTDPNPKAWENFMNPSSEGNVWEFPVVQSAFDDRMKSRVLQLITEKLRFFDVNDRLPQVLCHNDAHRRNLMWTHSPQTGGEELVAIDWSFTGPGALGNDLGELVGVSMFFFDYDPYDAESLEAAVLSSYLAGIADNGVRIDPRLARLGYLIALSFEEGAVMPGWAATILPPESGLNVPAMYGHSVEEVLAGWMRLEAFCLDRADEARHLIRQLGL